MDMRRVDAGPAGDERSVRRLGASTALLLEERRGEDSLAGELDARPDASRAEATILAMDGTQVTALAGGL